ncbi:hypothetical protein TJA_16290 [Thermus sp. LT1-2-5]
MGVKDLDGGGGEGVDPRDAGSLGQGQPGKEDLGCEQLPHTKGGYPPWVMGLSRWGLAKDKGAGPEARPGGIGLRLTCCRRA